MSRPITKAQLDALENVVDRVFANIGIDVEFTRHFLDRVNDERNRKQITIRELGELFAKEYKRWGREIAKMPVDTQAVMKDLSSELNIPFVLNPDGKEKDLVAKTVMRKKNFRTPNKELPVESVKEAGRHRDHVPRKGSNSEITINGITIPLKKESWGDWTVPYGKFKNIGNFKSKRELVAALKQKAEVNEGKHGKASNITHNGVVYKGSKTRGYFDPNTKKRYRHPEDVKDPKLRRALFPSHPKRLGGAYVDEKDNSFVNPERVKLTPAEVTEEKHGAKRGTQVKGKSSTPSKRKPTKGGETPHPMRGKLVGEGFGDNLISRKTFAEIMALKTDAELAKNYQEYVIDGGKGKGLHPRKLKQVQDAINYEIARRQMHDASNEESINEVSGGKVVATVNGYPIHDMGASYPHKEKRFLVRDPNMDIWQTSAPTLKAAGAKANELKPVAKQPPKTQAQIDHDDWRDEQRAKIATGEIRRAVRSRRGLGEANDDSFVKQFIRDKRREGWSVYASRINHGVEGAHRLEFEKDDMEFEVVGKGNHWELFHGPNLSGRGEKFDGLDAAFQTASQMNEAWPVFIPGQNKRRDEWRNHPQYDKILAARKEMKNPMRRGDVHDVMTRVGLAPDFPTKAILDYVNETMDEPPLDAPTMSVEEIADHHGVPVEQIEQQLEIGIEVEMEHTKDPEAAKEIALDHLMEMPNYYDELATIEPHHYTDESVRAAWQSYQMDEKIRDPREAMLDMALKFLDRKVHDDRDRQSLGGLAMDVAREVRLNQIGVNHKDLARLYRDWKGDSVVTEGWIEENLYYLDEVIKTDENFADGKVKGKSRPGRAKRAGVDAGKSVSALRKQAKNSSGEEQKMAHWAANMKAGRQRKKK